MKDFTPEQLEQIKEAGRDFSKLDLEGLTKRFGFRKMEHYGDVLYITSQQDEWYIVYNDIIDSWKLYHRNSKGRKRYHKEHMGFDNLFRILGYINHHDKKAFALGHTYVYEKSRLELLFDQINTNKNMANA